MPNRNTGIIEWICSQIITSIWCFPSSLTKQEVLEWSCYLFPRLCINSEWNRLKSNSVYLHPGYAENLKNQWAIGINSELGGCHNLVARGATILLGVIIFSSSNRVVLIFSQFDRGSTFFSSFSWIHQMQKSGLGILRLKVFVLCAIYKQKQCMSFFHLSHKVNKIFQN